MSDADFSRRSLVAIVVVCAISLVTAALLTAFLEEETESFGSDSYSVSALGHSALVELLKSVDVPVLVSRHDSGSRARSGLLVVAEPILGSAVGKRADALRTMTARARAVLLVLPKWHGVSDRSERGWIREVYPVETSDVETVLEALEIEGRVVRTPRETRWSMPPGLAPPTFPADEVQLIGGETLVPVVGASEGDLFVEVKGSGRRLFVLSDPDVLSNAGLHRGGNAALVLAAIERARPKGGTVVLDETMHGYESPPSLTRELLVPPLAFGTLHLLVVLSAVLWAAWGRFGAPARLAPALEPGTRALIQNTADLLRWGGHAGEALPRYLAHAIRDVRAALQAPATLAGDALDAWIDRVAASRGATRRLADVRKEAASAARTGPGARILAAAAEVHRWREEIVHGAGGRPQHP